MTSDQDLRKLVREWRNHGADGRTAQIFEICADELEELIEQ